MDEVAEDVVTQHDAVLRSRRSWSRARVAHAVVRVLRVVVRDVVAEHLPQVPLVDAEQAIQHLRPR